MAGDRPHRPFALREGLIQIALITVGVLIALSFDGIVAWRQNRALVRDARANLASEIRDNRDELQKSLQQMDQFADNLLHAADVADKMSKSAPVDANKVEVAAGWAELRDASRDTADVTGAFGLMPYEEVKRYATVYQRQEQWLARQNDTVQNVTRVLAMVHVFAEPKNATAREFDDLKRDIWLSLGSLSAQQQWGEALLREYDRVLQAQ